MLKIAFIINSGQSREDVVMATRTYCRLSTGTTVLIQLEVSYPSRLKARTNNMSTVLQGTLDLKGVCNNLPALLGMLISVI